MKTLIITEIIMIILCGSPSEYYYKFIIQCYNLYFNILKYNKTRFNIEKYMSTIFNTCITKVICHPQKFSAMEKKLHLHLS